MDTALLKIVQEGLYLALLISAPPVLASVGAALLISTLQATTQIQEQTLTHPPRLIAAVCALVIAAPWISAQMVEFTMVVFDAIPAVGRG